MHTYLCSKDIHGLIGRSDLLQPVENRHLRMRAAETFQSGCDGWLLQVIVVAAVRISPVFVKHGANNSTLETCREIECVHVCAHVGVRACATRRRSPHS